ncbi:amidophosphoribosyltransferase [Clostridium sp.]|uniref:amidophosphoribosyltransferase n=1 Tax=Clostridium sp. TaxID=1506 RepID=UPI0028512E4F|nr:amidophosphoribosyltransferase [Clostridium sp.]MDR3596449.1 amidophosphoribosyltransferase [Clostridium sp.]
MSVKRRIQPENNMNGEVVNMDKNIQETNVQAEEIVTEGQAPEATITENTEETATIDEANVTEIVRNATPCSAKNIIRATSNKGGFSVVKAQSGNRATIAKQGYEHLGKPRALQFAFTDTSVIIGANLPNNNNDFNVKDSNGKAIVYSTPLVREIAEAFELDFDNRTSMTFGDIQYTNSENSPVIIVKIK